LAGYVKKVFLNLFGEDIPVNTSLEENVSDFNRFSNIHRYVIDNKRLTDLGFKPKYDIERGIEAMFDYFSSK
jgi:nucleoside-diphosphate-sugar epimerase